MKILKKYSTSPKTFVLETESEYQKEDVVEYVTRYGKEIELIIYKLVFSRGGKNYYSYERSDGKCRKSILQARADKRREWSSANERKSNTSWEASKEKPKL